MPSDTSPTTVNEQWKWNVGCELKRFWFFFFALTQRLPWFPDLWSVPSVCLSVCLCHFLLSSTLSPCVLMCFETGSGQQSVTGVTAVEDSNSYWSVRGTSDALCHRGNPVKCGQTIRLTHVNTGRNLHSHYFASPLSSNQVRGVKSAHACVKRIVWAYYTMSCHPDKSLHWQAIPKLGLFKKKII